MKLKQNIYRTIIAGVFLGFHFMLFFTAVKLTFIANATFLCTLAPLFTLMFEVFYFKRVYSLKIIIGLSITLFGAFIILFNGFDLSGNYEAHFWFADSDDIGEAQIEYDITVGSGESCLLGDSNGDSSVDIMDIILMIEYILSETTDFEMECVDVNGDGSLDILDVVTLVDWILNN